MGLARYNAKASEALLGLSVLDSAVAKNEQISQQYKFSMEMTNLASRYRAFSFEVVSQNSKTKAVLSVQRRNGEAAVETYGKDIDEETFVAFWQALRELEVAQLTNLSPYTENLALQHESQKEDAINRPPSNVVPNTVKSAATYRFQFQDGRYDYPNSFEVYAPEAIADARYKALQDVATLFVENAFAEELAKE